MCSGKWQRQAVIVVETVLLFSKQLMCPSTHQPLFKSGPFASTQGIYTLQSYEGLQSVMCKQDYTGTLKRL